MARILIAGGSLGGLLAANLLWRDGHQVLLLERAAGSLDGRGAGIVTHAALLTALECAGVLVDAGLGVPVAERVLLGADGQVQARLALPQVLTSWSHLYRQLLAALPAACLRQGVAVARVESSSPGVRVHSEAAEVFEADLLIASDGLRSSVRAQLAPQAQPEYAGYVAWRGVCDEAVLSQLTRHSVFEHFGFALPAGEQLIGYPVPGPGHVIAEGKRRYNFVWYRPAPEPDALRALLSDADGGHHPLGIPPHKVSWRQVAAMREAARRLLAPQFAEIIEKTAQPFLQPIYDLSSPQIAFDNVALMGDAAFVARPHVGMGVTKAAADAMALRDCIARHGAGPAALQAYQAQRLPEGLAVVQRARELGANLSAASQGEASANLYRDADSVLRNTAVAPASPVSISTPQPPDSAQALSRSMFQGPPPSSPHPFFGDSHD